MNIDDFRRQYPQYKNISDADLTQKLHAKYYADVPYEDFKDRFAPRKLGAFEAGVAGLKYPIEKASYRLQEAAAKYIPGVSKVLSPEVIKQSRQALEKEYAQAAEQQPLATFVGSMIPETPAFFLPGASLGKAGKAIEAIPYAGKAIARGASEILPQALWAGAQSEKPLETAGETAGIMAPFVAAGELASSTSPVVRAAARGGAGLLAGGLGAQAGGAIGDMPGAVAGGLAGGLLGFKGAGGARQQIEELTQGLNKAKAMQRMQAAERLGLEYLTPAEAAKSPVLSQRQGQIGRTPEGSRLLLERGEKRLASEEKAIRDTFDVIFDKQKMPEMVRKKYQEVYPVELPGDLVDSWRTNEIVKRAERNLKGNPVYRQGLKDIPVDSVGYWDYVKRVIDDQASVAKRRGDNNKYRLLNNTRKEIINSIDEIAPSYMDARAFAEREKVRTNLEKVLDKKEYSGNQFYKALQSDTGFGELMHSLRNVPEAQQRLQDMRLIFNDLITVPSVRAASQLERTSMTRARSAGQYFEDLLKSKLGEKYDKQVVEFITNPKWQEELDRISSISDKQRRTAETIKLFGRGAAQSAQQLQQEQ